MEYFIQHAIYAFQKTGNGAYSDLRIADARYLLKNICCLARSGSSVNKRDLLQKCRGHMKKSEEAEDGLKMLVDRGYIRIERVASAGAGRPSDYIHLNPLVQESA